MNPQMIKALREELNQMRREGVRYRQGVVSGVAPLAVKLGGSDVVITGVTALDGPRDLAVDDVVGALSFGNDLLILGTVGGGTVPALAATTITTYANGWRAYAGGTDPSQPPASYYKTSEHIVHLEGLIDKNGGNWVVTETMFTLPTGFRPAKNLVFGPLCNGGGSQISGRVDVNTDGTVVLVNGAAAHPVNFVALQGITFRAV